MKKPSRSSSNATKNRPQQTSAIRIIAGKHRGRKLPVIDAQGLRPTTDRVKETVFNWLMAYVDDSQCLDCFAGAGSLGFEALSRGAAHITMLELNKTAAKQLQANKALLKADNIDIYQTDTLNFLENPTTQYNLVFIDPPFRQGLAQQVIEKLASGWLSVGAMVYVETEAEIASLSIPENWQLQKEKTAGQVRYQLYKLQ
ncbi:16S rRNA (guanine(966)-N(2))-methyltransferase RsmD [Colwellia sp. MEBiC06753]